MFQSSIDESGFFSLLFLLNTFLSFFFRLFAVSHHHHHAHFVCECLFNVLLDGLFVVSPFHTFMTDTIGCCLSHRVSLKMDGNTTLTTDNIVCNLFDVYHSVVSFLLCLLLHCDFVFGYRYKFQFPFETEKKKSSKHFDHLFIA